MLRNLGGTLVSEFSIEERRMRMTVKPYMKATREKMHKQKNTVFGNCIYLTNPMFYMDAKEILNVGQKSKNYQFVGELYVPDKAHKYQPLEKE